MKCDEAKPICKKCESRATHDINGVRANRGTGQDARIICDGYLSRDNKQVANKKPRKRSPTPKYGTHPLLPLPRASLNPDLLRDDPGTVFFHHFRTSTVTDLALPPYSTCFWDRHVLPLSNAVPALRYAATALGMAHRAFLLDSTNPSSQDAKQWLETIAVHQYNKSISQLLPSASSARPADVRTIITCSLLFYCLENIRGHPDESIQHLRAGSRLILSLPPHFTTETRQSGTKTDDSIRGLASLFARLGVEASLYCEDEVVPDLRSYMTPASRLSDDPSQPFQDFDVARNSLFDIYIDLGTCTNRSFVLARNGHKDILLSAENPYSPRLPEDLNPGTTGPSGNLPHGPSYADGLDTGPVVNRFKVWRRRFDKTVTQAEERGTTKRERQEIAMLQLRRRVWETMLDEVPNAAQAERILDQAEVVLRSFHSKHPMFTLESNVLPSVSFICFYSDDERHRRRALDILRSAHMREGVWDSRSMVGIIEPQFPELKLCGMVDGL